MLEILTLEFMIIRMYPTVHPTAPDTGVTLRRGCLSDDYLYLHPTVHRARIYARTHLKEASRCLHLLAPEKTRIRHLLARIKTFLADMCTFISSGASRCKHLCTFHFYVYTHTRARKCILFSTNTVHFRARHGRMSVRTRLMKLSPWHFLKTRPPILITRPHTKLSPCHILITPSPANVISVGGCGYL